MAKQFYDFLYPLEIHLRSQSSSQGTILIPVHEIFTLKKISFHLNSKSLNNILSCCFELRDNARCRIITKGKFHFVKTAFLEIDFPDYELLPASVLLLIADNHNKQAISVESILSGTKSEA